VTEPQIPFAEVLPRNSKREAATSWRKPAIIGITIALIFGALFITARVLHNSFINAAEPTYQALLKVKADFESSSVTDAQRSQDLHQAQRLFSQFQANLSTTDTGAHTASSVDLECAMGDYAAADAERRTASGNSLTYKRQADKYLAEARKKLDAGN